MKVIITEGGGANNIGSMALIENAIKIVRRKYPGTELTVFCLNEKTVSETLIKDGYGDNVKVMRDLFPIPNGGNLRKLIWLIQCVLWILYTRVLFFLGFKNISWAFWGRRKKNLQEAEQAEYIYCIGAERINDIYIKTALLSLYAIGTYIKMDKKLVHMSLTIGPVFNKSTIFVAKQILNKSHAILVRDQKSFDILKEWKCKAPYQFNSYDIALLQQINESKATSLLDEFGIESGFIGVSAIYWKFRKAVGPVRQIEYEKALADTLDYIIEKYNKQIVFTPTVVSGNKLDDAAIGDRIMSMMKHKENVISVHRLLTPVEMSTLFSQCQFSIVTRMHAAILCSGAGAKPIIAINYLYKLREYMKNIGFEDYSVDIDYVNEKELKGLVGKMVDNYDKNFKSLCNRQMSLRNTLNHDIHIV